MRDGTSKSPSRPRSRRNFATSGFACIALGRPASTLMLRTAQHQCSHNGSTARCVSCFARRRAPTSYYAPSLRSPWRAADGTTNRQILSISGNSGGVRFLPLKRLLHLAILILKNRLVIREILTTCCYQISGFTDFAAHRVA